MKNILRIACITALLILLLEGTASPQASDSLSVNFRLSDESHKFVHVFLPGDFNNWGPNSNGKIDSSAPSSMQYDQNLRCWTKQYRFKTGTLHSYKFYIQFDSAGQNTSWTTDSLNTNLDNNRNSCFTVTDPLVFEPKFISNADGNISQLVTEIMGTHKPLRIFAVIDNDSINISSGYNSAENILSCQFNPPVYSKSSIQIIARDSNGNCGYYNFWQQPAPPAYTIHEWAKHAVWYQIFPERFRNGDTSNDPDVSSLEDYLNPPAGWHVSSWTKDWYSLDSWEQIFYSNVYDRRFGGDIQGIIDKLGYLDSLGVNAIYLNPVFYSRSLHKYNASSLHHIDPYFGPDPKGDINIISKETLDPSTWHWTSADTLFLALLRDAHKRGMHVIIDGVFETSGTSFPVFQDLLKNQQNSIYKSWYNVLAWDDPSTPQNEFQYVGWYGLSSLPLYAHSPDGTSLNFGTKQYIYNITKRWMDPNGDGDPSDGVDGWRLDSPSFVPDDFWIDWNTYVRTINPDAYTTAEIWSYNQSTVDALRFSGSMNYYGCAEPMYYFFVKGGSADDFAGAMSANVGTGSQNLIDSHDTQRIATIIANSKISLDYTNPGTPNYNNSYNIDKPTLDERRLQRLIVFTQMTVPGSPMIYYGDEAGMWGAADPDDRKPMPWPDLSMQPEKTDPRGFIRNPDDANFDTALAGFYSSIVNIRRTTPSLSYGGWKTLYTDNAHHILVFMRSINSDYSVVFINRDTVQHNISVSLKDIIPQDIVLSFKASTESDIIHIPIQQNNSKVSTLLPPVSGVLIGSTSATLVKKNSPEGLGEFKLENAYPNPFNPATTIDYKIPYNGIVSLKVYDVLGRLVKTLVNQYQQGGNHVVSFNASNLASGVYYYQLRIKNFISTKKTILMK